jgi:uncharacterized protein
VIMIRTLKTAAAALIIAAGFAGSVAAGPFDDADAAYERGDYATALRLYRPPAVRGNAYAQASLGMMYETGHGVPQDYAAAASWYRKAADQGFVMAQSMLGVMYYKGEGVSQDFVQAYAWFDQAITSLAASETDYRNKTIGLRDIVAAKMTPSQLSEAQKLAAERRLRLANASRTAAVAAGAFKDGLNASKRGDYATAMRIWRPLANQGDAAAQASLGFMYDDGHGVAQDYAAAAGWYRKAADQGFAPGQFNLGNMYRTGHGVAQDDAAAMSWYRKAADQGHVTAQYNLGIMYDNGRGATQDYAAAASWFRKAADQGHVDAQFNLGSMYAKGLGIPQDYISAHMWLNLAAIGGDKDAARNRDIVAAKMNPTQVAEAQKRAAEWRSSMANPQPRQAAPISPASKKPDSEAFSGTAFFVSRDGKVLTNAHVVRGCRQISVNTEGQSSAAEVLARDDRNDLALLTVDLHPAQLINWRLSVRQGEDIVVYGFPLSGVLASAGNVAVGNITALAGLGNDSRFLQISAPVQPGNSGGPLLDRNGIVVGIVVAKLNALEIASTTGDIPQNVNFAIKASVAAAFLDAQRVTHAESAVVGALSTPDIAERAKSFTVQVVCVR